jgi:hypothetical protein
MSEDLAEKGRDYIRLHGRGGFVDGLISAMAARIEELERLLRSGSDLVESEYVTGYRDWDDDADKWLTEVRAVLEKGKERREPNFGGY